VWKPVIVNPSGTYPNDLYIQFGRQVKHLRNQRKLTQSQLAEASGLSVEFISLVERGRSAPSLKNIFGLSQALQAPVCAFFLFATDKTQLPDHWQFCAVDEQRYYLTKTQKMKILIVDDNHSFRESATDFLNMVEWIEVVAAADSAESARPLMTNHSPDVVLLDIGMPGLNGLDFAAEIRQRWPNIHIVFLTALDSPAYREKSVTLGAQGFVKKTDMMEQLIPLLESLG
jgi:CheY-like chemotaxis protein/DNA-binding XRE family transcriptional regulator